MKLVSDKAIRVVTLGGTAIRFEPGVPREVGEALGLLAMQQGAKPVGDVPPQIEEAVAEIEEAKASPEIADTERLVLIMEELIIEGDPKSFKSNGEPRASVVNRMFGRVATTEEREAAWEVALNR